MATMPDWKPYLLDLGSSDKDPVVYIHAPGWRRHFSQKNPDSSVITVSSSGTVGVHQWMWSEGNKGSDFSFDVDPSFLATGKEFSFAPRPRYRRPRYRRFSLPSGKFSDFSP